MMVMRDCVAWRQPALCEIAVPLGDRSASLVSQIQTANVRAALPAPVGWYRRPAEQGRAMRCMPDPLAADGDRVNVECHRLS
jgi:hypothetical protein